VTGAASLAGALLDAQRAMHGVVKGGRNVQQGWTFMSVEDVTRACRECLTGAGLVAVYRLTSQAPDSVYLDGYLHVVHAASGQEMKMPMPWPVERAGPQARRAAFSYARKQALVELLLVAEPDDPETEATTSASTPAKVSKAARKAPAAPQPMTDPQRRALWASARKAGYGDITELAGFAAGILGVDLDAHPDQLLGSLSKAEASQLIDALAAVKPATRSTEPDPGDDPWQAHPVAAIPTVQADQ
jgi:hypothetical protein